MKSRGSVSFVAGVLLVGLLASCGSVPPSLEVEALSEPLAQPGLYLNEAAVVTPEQAELVKAIWSMTPEATTELVRQLEAAPSSAQLDILKQNVAQQKTLNALGSYPGGLTAAEFKMCAAHPINCSKTKGYANDALAEAKRQFADGLYLGRGDAFRHAFWNGLMVSGISYSWAYDFATAHESETPSGNDKSMDLHNNRTGRLASASGVSRSTLISRMRSKVTGGSTKCLRGERASGALIYTNTTSCKNR